MNVARGARLMRVANTGWHVPKCAARVLHTAITAGCVRRTHIPDSVEKVRKMLFLKPKFGKAAAMPHRSSYDPPPTLPPAPSGVTPPRLLP